MMMLLWYGNIDQIMKKYIIAVLLCSVVFGCKSKHNESWIDYSEASKELPGYTIHSFVRKENNRITSEMHLDAPSQWENVSSRETEATNVIKLKNLNKQEEVVLVLNPSNNTIIMRKNDTSPSDIGLRKTGANRWMLVDPEAAP